MQNKIKKEIKKEIRPDKKEKTKKPVFITGTYESCINYVTDRTAEQPYIFNFAYVGEGETFREIDRFLWESRHKESGIGRVYSNRYSGVAVIDVTAWYKRYPNEYFDAFFYFLKDQYTVLEDIMFIAEKHDEQLMSRLSRFFDTEGISLNKDERGHNNDERGTGGSGRIGFEI